MADDKDDLLDPAEIEALLNSHLTPASTPPPAAPAPGSGASGAKVPAAVTAGGGERLSQRDLDSLFQQAGNTPAPGNSGGDNLGADELESLLRGGNTGSQRRGAAASATDALLDQVEADLASALAPESRASGPRIAELGGVKNYEFNQFDVGGSSDQASGLDALHEVELDLRIELGRTQLLIEEVLKLREGSVVPLDKLAGDPVDILVNGRLVARGEVLVLNDNFCVRIAEIVSPTF